MLIGDWTFPLEHIVQSELCAPQNSGPYKKYKAFSIPLELHITKLALWAPYNRSHSKQCKVIEYKY